MTQPFIRNRITWMAYLLLSIYSYFLNIIGPITPFLHDEFRLSFAVSSLHYSAFAAGMLVVGLGGHLLINRIGRELALAAGAAGLGAGALLLAVGRAPAVTIGAALLMGCVGSLILAVVPAALSEEHGEQRAVAIAESNVLSTISATAAPLLVGWLASMLVGWRMALVAAGLLSLVVSAVLVAQRRRAGALLRAAVPGAAPLSGGTAASPRPLAPSRPLASSRPLPLMYWFYWACLLLAVAVEFCMIGWTAGYMEQVLGLAKATAAQTVSLFLGGMIAGRYLGSRLLRWLPSRSLVIASLLAGMAGFLLFWGAPSAAPGMVGLALTGLGVASLYPLLLSMAIEAAAVRGKAPFLSGTDEMPGTAVPVSGGTTSQAAASARAALASGSAIFILPLLLGRLADLAGLKSAFGVVVVLFAALFVMMLLAGAQRPQRFQKPLGSGLSSDSECR